MVMAVVFVLTFPFFPRSLKNFGSVGLSSCVALSPGRYEGLLGERACAVKPSRDVYVFSEIVFARPLSHHHHTPDPCASNVNNPAFPESRGGASVKQWREAVKYREIQPGNSAHTLLGIIHQREHEYFRRYL